MRFVWLCTLLVLFAGCRWAGVSGARRDVMSEALQAQRFPLRPEEAASRMRGRMAHMTRCDRLETGELRCGGCIHGHCFQLLDDDGSTRVTANAELSETELTSIWEPIDQPSLQALRSELDERVQVKLIEQDETFEPRWGATAGVLASLSTEISPLGPVALGGRAGVRRWFDANLIGHAAVEYRYKGEHELSFRVGLEVARWTDGRLWGAAGAPGASVSMFMGPMFRLGAFRAGLRTGVGFHLTDFRSAPIFMEAAAETTFAGEASRVTGVFTIGLGI